MPWKLEPQEHHVFARNPLVAVVAQVRFHPILQVGPRVAEYQDRVRSNFPAYEVRRAQNIQFAPSGGVQVTAEDQHVFTNPREQTSLFLSTTALALESRLHRDRAVFQELMSTALASFLDLFRAFSATRLGLRYVNAISPKRIEADLARPVSIESLLTEPFRSPPGSVTAGDDTRYSGEVVSAVRDQGFLALRFAHGSPVFGGPPIYQIDLDRYLEGDVAPGDVTPLMRNFSDDIYTVFRSAAGPDLVAWMNGDGMEAR